VTRRRALATLLVAIFVLGAAQVAFAHTITRAEIRTAARAAARSIGTETGASSSAVLRCRRLSDHRARCKVEARYSSGARRCETVVSVRLVGEKARWSAGETTCY
jgi:hypothetical protein